MPDYNVNTALSWANELGSPPSLPPSLSSDIHRRANVAHRINEFFISGSDLGKLSDSEKKQRLNLLRTKSATLIHDISDDNTRVNASLRLWAGCLGAAKTIAFGTVEGENDPKIRARIFKDIDSLVPNDPLFAAGVEAASAFKKLHSQQYSFDGVPENSIVRKYPNEYLIK